MAMLGIGNYLCEACKNFDTDGADGNHPSCSKQPFSVNGQTAIPLGKECPFGCEFGIPSGYPVSMPRNEKRAYEIKALLDKARDAAEIDDLKDCPFCGGGAEESTIFNDICEDWIAVVKCVDCYAFVRCEEDTEAEALEMARHDWNARVERNAAESVQRFAQRYENRIAELEKENAMLETTLALAGGSLDVAATHEVEKDRLIADLTQLVLDMHAHPCKGFVNCPSNGCQWWSAERKKCQIGERMRDLGIAEFGVPWKAKR